MVRDVVLLGASSAEIEALAYLCSHPDAALPPSIAHSLRAKGWIDTAGDYHLLTLTGRVLIDRR